VRAALEELPQEEQRRAFWRQSVQPESALAPVRHLLGMRQLERRYAQ
jgi:hypothetical protein